MKRLTWLLVLALSLSAVALQSTQPAAQAAEAQKPAIASPPVTPKKPVSADIRGVKITDNYQWLEKNDDPQVRAWVSAQNERARNYLDSLPEHAQITDWLKQLVKFSSPSYYEVRPAGGVLFVLKSQPGTQQDMLVTLKSPDDLGSERVVMDPNTLDAKGGTSIQFYVPSLDGKYVAVCLAEGGSEAGRLHVYEVASGKALSDVVPRVNFPTAGGSVAWNGDSSGFFYTRYPHEGERLPQDVNFYQQIYFHKLGTSADQDTYALGKDFPRIAEIDLTSSDDGKYLLATIANGDGGQYEHFLRDGQGKWTQLTRFSDQVSAATFGADGALYLVSRQQASRGKLLRRPLATPNLARASIIVPESDVVIQGFGSALSGFPANLVATRDRIYLVDVNGGPQQVRIFDYAGKQVGLIPMEPISSVERIVRLENGNILFHSGSYLKPSAWYRYDPQQGKTTLTALHRTSPVDFSDVEAMRETAISKDGTKVPLTVIRKKGTKLDGTHPALLTGYGGFSISMTPEFNAAVRIWLDAGGVYAIANLRGGGEYGDEWHRAGMLTNKQHVFDDLIACAEHLVQAKYTNPEKLVIEGGSNGGLLMGAVLTQRPELFRAVVSVAGLYDMMRYETTQNGQFNMTEYGSIQDPAQFKVLLGYSPYQHVVDGTTYPAILLTVGENDLRVDPWHSRKFSAALQAATTSGLPVFLISFGNAGHGGIGAGEDLQIAMRAYNWTFAFGQVGAKFQSAPLPNAVGH
jgi:prolyl oligopeptidase